MPVLLARLVDRDHVRVLDRGGEPRLAPEALAEALVGRERRGEHLERPRPGRGRGCGRGRRSPCRPRRARPRSGGRRTRRRAPGRAGAPPSAHPRSRTEITPFRSASSTSRTRFWFCGRSPIPNFSNRARRWPLTASSERKTSSAICWLVAGVAYWLPSRNGRQSATRIRRWVSVSSGASAALGRGDRGRARRRLRGAEDDDRRPEAKLVAVGEPPPAADALAVEEGAVAGEAVVGDRPLAADALDLGVQARDLLVDVEADVDLRPAPDRDPLTARIEGEDALSVRRRARAGRAGPGARPRAAALKLGRRGRMGCRRALHRTQVSPCSGAGHTQGGRCPHLGARSCTPSGPGREAARARSSLSQSRLDPRGRAKRRIEMTRTQTQRLRTGGDRARGVRWRSRCALLPGRRRPRRRSRSASARRRRSSPARRQGQGHPARRRDLRRPRATTRSRPARATTHLRPQRRHGDRR